MPGAVSFGELAITLLLLLMAKFYYGET